MDFKLSNGILLAACVLLPAVIYGQSCPCPATACPDGWTTFRGSCYHIYDNASLDWTESIVHCQQHDSHLVIIESQDEDSFIKSQLERLYRSSSQHPGEEFWIGANDEMIEGVWVWYMDDKSLTYTGWYPGQPGSEGDEDCVVIASRMSSSQYLFNGWHDAPCSARHHPVCEMSNRQDVVSVIG